MMHVTRRAAMIGFSILVTLPSRAEPAAKQGQETTEVVELERPVMFEVVSRTGSLKETAQAGQELTWHQKGKSSDRRFQLTSISIAFLRSETGGQIKMTFSCNISSFGYSAEEAKLNVIVRSKGGAALHTWGVGIPVKCEDKNQPLTPLAQTVPADVSANVFVNVNTVEIAEHTDPNLAGVKLQRCGSPAAAAQHRSINRAVTNGRRRVQPLLGLSPNELLGTMKLAVTLLVDGRDLFVKRRRLPELRIGREVVLNPKLSLHVLQKCLEGCSGRDGLCGVEFSRRDPIQLPLLRIMIEIATEHNRAGFRQFQK